MTLARRDHVDLTIELLLSSLGGREPACYCFRISARASENPDRALDPTTGLGCQESPRTFLVLLNYLVLSRLRLR